MATEQRPDPTTRDGLIAAVERQIAELQAKAEQLRADIDQLRAAAAAASPQAPSPAGSPILGGINNEFTQATSLTSSGPFTLEINNNHAAGPGVGFALEVISDQRNGIAGNSSSTGFGVSAFSRDGVALQADTINGRAIFARGTGGEAVFALNEGNTNSIGVAGVSRGGVGVYAQGGQASLLLAANNFAGPPTSGIHETGEIVLDSNVNLYLCKDGGTPGTWAFIG